MKKSEIIALVNNGLLNATQHELSTAHSYKVFKLKSEVRKKFTAIGEDEDALRKECGIEDATEFDKRMNELRAIKDPTDKEKKELKAMVKQATDYVAKLKILHDEDVALEGIKTMPYSEWVLLQKENRTIEFMGRKVDVFSGIAEDLLYGVLWVAPDEEEVVTE